MSQPPPRRHSSMELTIVIPRDELPPISKAHGPTIEQLADVARAQRDAESAVEAHAAELRESLRAAQDEIDTLIPCPGPCKTCPCCHGGRPVPATKAKAWLDSQASTTPSEEA